MPRKGRTSIDKIVGQNVRIRRLAKGLSQTELARPLGVTFQQVKKYENGTNRIGSGRLLQIAHILEVDIKALFEGSELPERTNAQSPLDLIAEPQSFRLMQSFSEIADPQVRRSLVTLVETLAHARKP
jgi:transcriptional regulator with XRE-family HTH domain